MKSLKLSQVEAEAHIHKSAFPADWSVFSRSITWFKLKKDYDCTEREHFRTCWESL